MAFRVEISKEAEHDATSILDWLISQHAGETGLRWLEGLEKTIASLANMPERCPLAPEDAEFPFEVRHLLYGRKPHIYRIVFTVDGETVYVLHIWHGRRRHIKPQ